MSRVCQFIERLAETEEQRQFAQAAQRWGDNLERAWAESQYGAGLLWLAVAAGVDPKQIVDIACELFKGGVEQLKSAGRETIQILEAVQAWQRGERSAEEVILVGVEVSRLIEDPSASPGSVPEREEMLNAAVWLTILVGESVPLFWPNDLLVQGTWYFVEHLAHALKLHQGWKSSDDDPAEGYQHAYAQAMRRFAIIIHRHLTGMQVQAAAQARGLWPLI